MIESKSNSSKSEIIGSCIYNEVESCFRARRDFCITGSKINIYICYFGATERPPVLVGASLGGISSLLSLALAGEQIASALRETADEAPLYAEAERRGEGVG